MKKYGVDMSGLDEAYEEECSGFFSLSSLWRELSGRQVVSEPLTVKGEWEARGVCAGLCLSCTRFLVGQVGCKGLGMERNLGKLGVGWGCSGHTRFPHHAQVESLCRGRVSRVKTRGGVGCGCGWGRSLPERWGWREKCVHILFLLIVYRLVGGYRHEGRLVVDFG